MEPEPNNPENTTPDEAQGDPEQQPIRVKRRRRRSKSQASVPSVPSVRSKSSKGDRQKSIWKSPVVWVAMNVVTAAITYLLVKLPTMQSIANLPEFKSPPTSKQAAPGNEPVEEVNPLKAAPARKLNLPALANFFGKPGSVKVDEDASPPASRQEGISVPKDFHPQSLAMQQVSIEEADLDDSAQAQKSAALAQAELLKTAKYREASDLDKAMECYREAMRLDPKSAEAANGLGQTLQLKGRTDEALVLYFKAVRLKPGFVAPLNSLAWIAATHPNPAYRNGKRAVELAERACKISEDAASLDTLAAAYAEADRYKDAVETAQKAMDVARKAQQQALVDQIQKRMEQYKAGQPHRSS